MCNLIFQLARIVTAKGEIRHIIAIEKKFNVRITTRENQIKIKGDPNDIDTVERLLGQLLSMLSSGNKLVNGILTRVDTFLGKHLKANTTTAENTTEMKQGIAHIDTSVSIAVEELTGQRRTAARSNS